MDRLTSENIEARKAGTSYGKWKADQDQEQMEPPDVSGIDPDRLRYCKNCGAPFETGKHFRLFCSRGCSQKYWKVHNRQNMRENRYRNKED